MTSIFSQKLSDDAEVRRVEVLYDSLPSSIVVSLIGIFLCFLVLFETAGMAVLKVWVSYMLSVLAVRVAMRYLFSTADRRIETMLIKAGAKD